MQFSSEFMLNREHFSECYDQSALLNPPKKVRYKFIASLLAFGFIVLMFTEQSVAVGLFFIGLAFVEYFSWKYAKAWWLSRQMWSKNSGNRITLKVGNEGIEIISLYQNQNVIWDNVKEINETPLGLILKLEKNTQYLSKSTLNDEVINFMKAKVEKVQA